MLCFCSMVTEHRKAEMVEQIRDLESHAWPPLIWRTDLAHLAVPNFSPYAYQNFPQLVPIF